MWELQRPMRKCRRSVWPRTMCQYSNMARRLSGHTSIFGFLNFFLYLVLFSLAKSLGNWGTIVKRKICNFDKSLGAMLEHWYIERGLMECDNVKTPYYPFLLNYLSSGRLRAIKNKGKFQSLSSKSGRSRLREVVAYKRFQIQWFDWQTFGMLENWSLAWGGRNRRFDCNSLLRVVQSLVPISLSHHFLCFRTSSKP